VDRITLTRAAQMFVKAKVQDGGSRETSATYEVRLLEFVVNVGADDLAGVTEFNVRRHVQMLRDRGVGANTIRRDLSVLSSFCAWAMTEPHPSKKNAHMLETNPVRHVKRPKHVPPPEKWLSLEELQTMLAACTNERERLALGAVADQPLRASEWCRAVVGDLYKENGSTGVRVRVKGGGFRKKALSAEFAGVLVDSVRVRDAQPHEPLLLNRFGQRLSRQGLSGIINRITARAGLAQRVRAHMIRHTIASAAAFNGASVYEIAEMLNHRSLQTAQRYIHGVKGDAALDSVRRSLWSQT